MYNKFRRLLIVIVSLLSLSICLSGCISSGGTSPQESSQADDLYHGIKKPNGFAPMPLSSKSGLGVYGSGRVEPGNETVMAEIDVLDLTKIKEGYTVSLTNTQKKIILTGKVKSLQGSGNATSYDICTIEVELDEPDTPASSTPAVETSKDNNDTASQSSTTITAGNGIVIESSDVEITINLPKKDGVWCVYNKCIYEGNDGKKYVWTSTKAPQDIRFEDWELKEITTGETDGKRTEIIDGLDGNESVLLSF